MENIGIVSEIRTATLLKADNPYLKYPCKVILHVIERGRDGSIRGTVSTGGCFVGAPCAVFADVSDILPLRYQHFNPIEEYPKLF